MKKPEAASLLRGLRQRTASGRARFILEAYLARIEAGSELPFSHPYQWATFYVTGTTHIRFPDEAIA
jgi:hypothetical protein